MPNRPLRNPPNRCNAPARGSTDQRITDQRFTVLEYYERRDGRGFEEIRRLENVAARDAAGAVRAALLGREGFSDIIGDLTQTWAYSERPCISFGGPPAWLQIVEAERIETADERR